MIDQKLQKYYEDRFSMMSSQGWQDLMDDVQKMYDSLNQVMPITTEQDLHLRRGQLDLLNWLLNLKGASETAFEQLMSGDSSDSQDV